MSKRIRKVVYPILLVIVLYLLGGLILQRNQWSLIFHPGSLSRDFQFHFDHPFREFNIPFADSAFLNMVLVRTENPRGMVIYFHGNSGNLSTQASYIEIFLQHHYDVLMMDYPGFGKSKGPDAEHDFYNVGRVAYQLAGNYFSPDSIIIYGRSLGSAMAAQLASQQPCKMLVLESPFYRLDDLVIRYFPIYPVSFLLQYHFPTYRFIQRVKAPVVVFHSKKDRVVPYRTSAKLKPLLKPEDQYITLETATHNTLYVQPVYIHKMDSLLRE